MRKIKRQREVFEKKTERIPEKEARRNDNAETRRAQRSAEKTTRTDYILPRWGAAVLRPS
jgi:hypothetical protein